MIRSEINGQKVLLVASTSGSETGILPKSAQQLGLTGPGVSDITFYESSGKEIPAFRANVAKLKLGALEMTNVKVVVAGSRQSEKRPDIVGYLALPQFLKYDIELDISAGVIRLFKATGCEKSELIYWEGAYTVAPMREVLPQFPVFAMEVKLNGKRFFANLNTGASMSLANLPTARSAGVTTSSPGVVAVEKKPDAPPGAIDTWIATFDTFSIGDEAIRNAKLLIGDYNHNIRYAKTGSLISKPADFPDMDLGADFFRSHRVLISATQRKVYVSYKGGPVFQVKTPSVP